MQLWTVKRERERGGNGKKFRFLLGESEWWGWFARGVFGFSVRQDARQSIKEMRFVFNVCYSVACRRLSLDGLLPGNRTERKKVIPGENWIVDDVILILLVFLRENLFIIVGNLILHHDRAVARLYYPPSLTRVDWKERTPRLLTTLIKFMILTKVNQSINSILPATPISISFFTRRAGEPTPWWLNHSAGHDIRCARKMKEIWCYL